MTRVLMLMTSVSELSLLDGSGHPSGFWAEEFVVPYELFTEAGWQVDVATCGGRPPTPDAGSLTPAVVAATRPAGRSGDEAELAAEVDRYRKAIETAEHLRAPLDIAALTPPALAAYDGVFLSGGHGAMEDLPHDPGVTRVMRGVLDRELPLAAVCHGGAALLPLRDGHGHWPLAGYRMTAFSHEEELVTDMAGRLPFVLQVELERLGARYEKAPVPWDSCVVHDRNLLTGQNPHSSTALARAFVDRLGPG
jgi:putative intracellular protease/amidase